MLRQAYRVVICACVACGVRCVPACGWHLEIYVDAERCAVAVVRVVAAESLQGHVLSPGRDGTREVLVSVTALELMLAVALDHERQLHGARWLARDRARVHHEGWVVGSRGVRTWGEEGA